MRVVTWNMGCAYGNRYKTVNERTWRQLLAWQPEVALVQETLRPPKEVDPDSWVFQPYGHTDEIGTLVYSRHGDIKLSDVKTRFLASLPGQVTTAEVMMGDKPWLFASIHAHTSAVTPNGFAAADLKGVGASTTDKVYPLDLILDDLRQLTPRRRFVVGGDLNAALRFDDLYTRGASLYGNLEWFSKARDAGWWNAHRKFHTGEERTLFRPGKPDEHFQIDHLFTDKDTWTDLQRCDVLSVPFLSEFSDHAPLMLEVG